MKRYDNLEVLCEENNFDSSYVKDEVTNYLLNEGSEEMESVEDEPVITFALIDEDGENVYIGITSVKDDSNGYGFKRYYWIEE